MNVERPAGDRMREGLAFRKIVTSAFVAARIVWPATAATMRATAGAASPSNVTHQQGIRYPKGVAGSKPCSLPGASSGRLPLSSSRHLSAGRTARDANRPILLPRGTQHLEFAARLPVESLPRRPGGRRGCGRDRGGKQKRRGRRRCSAVACDLAAFRGALGTSALGAGACGVAGDLHLDAAYLRRVCAHGL